MAVATTDESGLCLPNLQPLWHSKAPRSLHLSCPADERFSGWKAWQDYLRKRKQPNTVPFLTKKKSPLLWGWPHEWERDALKESIASPTALAEAVIGGDSATLPDLPIALQSVALAYALPDLAIELPAEIWWQLLERLHCIATQARVAHVEWQSDPQGAVRQQLLAGELPLALSSRFPEIRATRSLRNNARAVLSDALTELTDGQGLPDARLLPVLGPLFACWTRSRWLGSKLKRGPWSREAELQYQWLVRHAIRLADKGGRFVLTTHVNEASDTRLTGDAWDKKLFEVAIELAGDRGDCAAAAAALPRGVVSKRLKKRADDLPKPSLNSDWSGITIMSNGWSQSDVRLALGYAKDPMTIELAVGGKQLFAGAWQIETSCNACEVKPIGDWEQLCWESGKRFDFLEVGLKLTEGLRLERQLLFARDDRVLYLADIIICGDQSPRDVRHSFSLPLTNGVTWQPEIETRDGLLVDGKVRSAVLPLALSEWRSDPRGGSLTEKGARLVLTQEANCRALCCPLLLDLKPQRAKKERTWRRLTVGENLEIVPQDVAVGYRAQSGNDQWLIYRSLGPVGNRTVLGQNIAGEFCAGRFSADSKFDEWIEIEAV